MNGEEDYYGDEDWYYEDYDEGEPYIEAQKGAIMDHLWYFINSYGEQPETCSLSSECGDNGMTKCCVQVLMTDESGSTMQ